MHDKFGNQLYNLMISEFWPCSCNECLIHLLASKRSERDTLRCNTIKISVYLFIYMVRATSFSARATNWRASEASETLSGVYKFELVRYVYIYIYIYMYGGTYVILVAHATYT